MILLPVALSFSAFSALSLAMEKHQLELHGKTAATSVHRTCWRYLGWTLLALTFGLCVWSDGWSLGPVLWLGAMTISGVLIAYGLYPYRPHWIVPLAGVLPLLGLGAALL